MKILYLVYIVYNYDNKYKLETISGFAQKIVLAYVSKEKIPEQEAKNYFDYIIEKSTQLLKLSSVQSVVKYSFQGVFVDEYQDCTVD